MRSEHLAVYDTTYKCMFTSWYCSLVRIGHSHRDCDRDHLQLTLPSSLNCIMLIILYLGFIFNLWINNNESKHDKIYNFHQFLVRTKLNIDPTSNLSSTEKKTCPYIQNSLSFINPVTNLTYPLQTHTTFFSSNLIFILTCILCDAFYIGESSSILSTRMNGHQSSTKKGNRLSLPVAIHTKSPQLPFNSCWNVPVLQNLPRTLIKSLTAILNH
jgi:hypothetical protein